MKNVKDGCLSYWNDNIHKIKIPFYITWNIKRILKIQKLLEIKRKLDIEFNLIFEPFQIQKSYLFCNKWILEDIEKSQGNDACIYCENLLTLYTLNKMLLTLFTLLGVLNHVFH